MSNNLWTRDELILTLSVYFQLPFGRLNRTTPEVQELARIIGRSVNSAALRLVNFAACDPYIVNSGRIGMSAGIPICKPIWDEFASNREGLFCEAQIIKARFLHKSIEETLGLSERDLEGKERTSIIRQRVNQTVFRSMVLYNYEDRCAITGISIPELLVAGHIIPWVESTPEQKLNPENGICLSALYDRAFDKGLITITPDYSVMLSSALLEYNSQDFFEQHFGCIKNRKINLPLEHQPNRDYLAYHNERVFLGK